MFLLVKLIPNVIKGALTYSKFVEQSHHKVHLMILTSLTLPLFASAVSNASPMSVETDEKLLYNVQLIDQKSSESK